MNKLTTILSSVGVLSLRFSAPTVSGSSSVFTISDSFGLVNAFSIENTLTEFLNLLLQFINPQFIFMQSGGYAKQIVLA